MRGRRSPNALERGGDIALGVILHQVLPRRGCSSGRNTGIFYRFVNPDPELESSCLTP